jgi:O-antigen/teichoic acid export membrane protein
MRLPLGDKNTLIGRASRALGVSFINIAAARFGTLAFGVLLARLLGPHQFGTYAVAFVALLAILSFNELGVSLAIVRWPGEPREIAPTVVTLSCVSSAILFAGFFLAAPAFAATMGAPAAAPVIRVLAICILIDGVVAVPAALLQRYFRQDRRMIVDQTGVWLSTAVSVGLAWAGFGAMSLGIGQAAGGLVSGILLLVFSPLPFRFGFDVAKARALLVFGLPLAGSSILVFLVGNVDNLVVGHVLGATSLGFYVLAWNLSSWPVQMFSQPVRNVAPAFFARLQHDPATMRAGLLSGAGILGSLTLPVCLFISGAATPIVTFVYGARWAPAAPALTWLALLGALRILFELVYDYFVVLARSRVVFTIQLAWLVALIPALVVGVRADGISGAAIAGVAVAAFVVLPWYLIELHRVGIKGFALGAQLRMPLVGGVGVGLLAADLGRVLTSNLTALALSGVVAVGTIGVLFLHKQPELAMLRPMFSDTSEAHLIDTDVDRATSELTGEPAPSTMRRTGAPVPEPETVLIPALREHASRMPRIDENIYAADATISFPIFREVGWPLPVYRGITGLPPRYPAPAEATNRDRGRHNRKRSLDLDIPMGSTPQPSRPYDDPGREDSQALARRRQGPSHED